MVSSFIFQLHAFGHIYNAVLTWVNVVKLDVEIDNVDINIEMLNVDSTLFIVVKFNFDLQNIVLNVDLTLFNVVRSYHPSNNVKTTLKCLLGVEFFGSLYSG